MAQDDSSKTDWPKHVKRTAIVGVALFGLGILSIFATWGFYREVWLVSGFATLVGAFLLTHSLIMRRTNMG